ncbi:MULTISPECIES: hypothetical protein [unclassified Marinovum]
MSIDFFHEPRHQLAIIRVSGTVSTDTCTEVFSKLVEFNPETASKKVFYDMSGVEKFELDFDDLHDLVALRRDYYGADQVTQISIWAMQDLAFGMSRMYSSLLGQFKSIEVDVFRDLTLAAEYLDVPIELIAPDKIARRA